MTNIALTNPKTNQRVTIRNETPADYQAVETLTRAAFYNQYMPGCVEHYLVHVMRDSEDFLPALDLVAEVDGVVIGNIMYTRAWLTDEGGQVKPILTFGPLAVAPEYQRCGYGKMLIEASFQIPQSLGEDAVVIFGIPGNYVARGFKCCADLQVAMPNGDHPAAMLVKELRAGSLAGHHWTYAESPVMDISLEAAEAFDAQLPALTKKWQPSQEEFNIISRATISVEAWRLTKGATARIFSWRWRFLMVRQPNGLSFYAHWQV